MELVYLWVKDYKNIKNQGFNFSPRFEFEYIQEKNELVLKKEKKDYVSIFPKNINITAIVGENGSGKSSIVKLILMSIFYKKYKETNNYKDEIIMLEQELKDKSLFLIINTGERYKKISLNVNPINSSVTELDKDAIDFYSIYFSYMLDTLQNKEDYWIRNLYHKSDGYTTPILLTPNKFHKDFLQNSINLDDIEYINIKHSIKFYKKEIKTKINDFFNPNQIKLYAGNPSIIQNVEFDFFGKVAGKFLDLNNRIKKYAIEEYYQSKKAKRDKTEEYYENINKKIKAIKDLEIQKEYKKINLLYIAFKILSSAESSFQVQVYDAIKTWFYGRLYEDTFLEDGINLIEENIDNIFSNDTIKYDNEKINDCIEFHKKSLSEKEEVLDKLLNREILELSNIKNISVILVPWLDLELLENKKIFNSLSGGQKLLFTFMVNMMYEVSNLIQEDYKTINLFLDEVEASYHPKWQKEFIKNISKALENIDLRDKKINILFSSHSPFVLSDLPKKNVIFLEEGKQVKPFKDNEQTFGANIHTLLSHGFFMKDGLMGEFAKGKIEEIKNFYDFIQKFKSRINLKKKVKERVKQYYLNRKERFDHIQSIIGEPFLQTVIKNYLDELEQIFNNKNYKLKQKEKLLSQFSKEELQKYLDEQ